MDFAVVRGRYRRRSVSRGRGGTNTRPRAEQGLRAASLGRPRDWSCRGFTMGPHGVMFRPRNSPLRGLSSCGMLAMLHLVPRARAWETRVPSAPLFVKGSPDNNLRDLATAVSPQRRAVPRQLRCYSLVTANHRNATAAPSVCGSCYRASPKAARAKTAQKWGRVWQVLRRLRSRSLA